MSAKNWRDQIRTIPDFPETGVLFCFFSTLLKNGPAFSEMINELAEKMSIYKPDLVVGPESRGFIMGSAVAFKLGCGFVPVRKPGKLPAEVLRHEYKLEYGTDTLEIHQDSITKGQRVIIVDDLLATGGTAGATVKMIEALGGEVVALGFLIELTYLNGREHLKGYPIETLIEYE